MAAPAPRPAYKLYAPFSNARDYLYAELKIQEFLDWENGTDPSKRGYNPCIAVRHTEGRHPGFQEMRRPVPPRADGRKFAIGNHENHKDVRKWLGPTDLSNLPYLRNCPLWEGDIYLEKLRAKHTDEELDDLFVSFWQCDKLTWSEMMAWENLPQMQERLYEAEKKAKMLEVEVAAVKKGAEAAAKRPEILSQSAMQMVIAITMIARACPEADFKEIHGMWKEHAEADAAEVAEKARAEGNADAMRSLLRSWMAADSPLPKCLCACLEPGCPTFDKIYVKGRGFVDRWVLEDEKPKKLSAKPDHWGSYCGDCTTPEMCPDCQPLVCGDMEELDLGGGAAGGGAAGGGGGVPPPAPAAPAPPPPPPAPKKTWAQIAGAPKRV